MSGKFFIISFFLTAIAIFFEYLLSGFMGIVGSVIDIVGIAIFATLISRIFSRTPAPLGNSFIKNGAIIGSVFGIFAIIILSGAFIANTWPTSISEIHMTDGNRQIVFVQMSHIGTPRYYDDVTSRLTTLAQSGYTLYREGVLPGTPENQARFDALLGIQIHSGTYDAIASWIGMEAQSDRIFSQIGSGFIDSVDLSIDDIISLVGTGEMSTLSPDPVDPLSEIVPLREELSGPLFPYIVRAIMNLSLRVTSQSDTLLDTINPLLGDGIIHQRNLHIVKTLYDTPKNIVIVYGALHFEGVYALLQSRDPRWHIVSLSPLYPYQP